MLRKLLTHPVLIGRPAVTKGGAPASTNQAAFVTTDSLASFSGASLAITIVWKVLQAVFKPAEGTGPFGYLVVPLILSLLWAAYNFYMGYSEPDSTIKSGPEMVKAAVVAFVNAFFLTASVLGIDSVT